MEDGLGCILTTIAGIIVALAVSAGALWYGVAAPVAIFAAGL